MRNRLHEEWKASPRQRDVISTEIKNKIVQCIERDKQSRDIRYQEVEDEVIEPNPEPENVTVNSLVGVTSDQIKKTSSKNIVETAEIGLEAKKVSVEDEEENIRKSDRKKEDDRKLVKIKKIP